MKFLKVMMLITLLLANYSASAHAFAGKHDCAQHKTSQKHDDSSPMKDCCKDMAGKMKQCGCDACGSCVTAAMGLLTGLEVAAMPVADLHSLDPASFLPRLGLSNNLRPPDLLA